MSLTMAPIAHPALLPSGFTDLLPPHAAQEDLLTHNLLQLYQAHGYARVSPPLLEFEENLLAGSGASLAPHTFRLMDPLSGQMLGLRADMTVQVARLATTRLADVPRPLRLTYAGQVVRQSNSEHRPERQSGQIGLELIGSPAPAADAEIIKLACVSLAAVGCTQFTLDLTMPTLVRGLCQVHGLDAAQSAALRHALDRKDAAAVTATGGALASLLLQLLRLSGKAVTALQGLRELVLPAALEPERQHILAVWELLRHEAFAANTMCDFVESRGFEYHTGLGYSLFAQEPALELGRGGRYHSKARGSVEPGEPATGFTFYSENLLATLPAPTSVPRLYLPYGTPTSVGSRYRTEGYITVAGLAAVADIHAAAQQQNCQYAWHQDQLISVGQSV